MHVQAEEDEQPLSQIFRIPIPSDHCNACGQIGNGSWQPQVDRLLDMLEKRIVGVEEKLGTVVDGIARIVTELGTRSRDHRLDAGVQTSAGLVEVPVAHLHAVLSPGLQRGNSGGEDKGGRTCAATPAPTQPQQQSSAQDGGARGGIEDHPIVVTDDVSSSGGNKIDSIVGSPGGGSKISKRVHANPRQRVVPFTGILAGPAHQAPAGDQRDAQAFYVAPHTTMYKDPPGYEGVTDFGPTTETAYAPPVLQPKRHGVRIFFP